MQGSSIVSAALLIGPGVRQTLAFALSLPLRCDVFPAAHVEHADRGRLHQLFF
jgi:hypothetical protein